MGSRVRGLRGLTSQHRWFDVPHGGPLAEGPWQRGKWRVVRPAVGLKRRDRTGHWLRGRRQIMVARFSSGQRPGAGGLGARWRVCAVAAVLAVPFTAVLAVPSAGAVPMAAAASTPSGQVVDGHARFEVLSPTLIRLEYAGDDQFQDGTTFNVVNRNFPVPRYTTDVTGGWREIRTS